MKNIKTEVKHSESKNAWNVINTILGCKYKIARVPYVHIPDNDILTTRNKAEAMEHALFISRCFNYFDNFDIHEKNNHPREL
jgi:hypothetical protein